MVAARGLHQAGASAVLTGGRLTAEDAFGYSTFARVALGTNDIDFRARPHTAEEADFLAAHVVLTGPDGGGVTYADLEAAKTVVLVGFEPEDEAGAIFLRLRKASARPGTRVLAIAPFSTRGLRKMAGTLVPTAPGDEPAALEALVGHADYGVDKTTVVLVGERLADGARRARGRGLAGPEDRRPAGVGPAPGRRPRRGRGRLPADPAARRPPGRRCGGPGRRGRVLGRRRPSRGCRSRR